jgi:hypothetical protein
MSHPDPNMWRIPRATEHNRQLVPVTKTTKNQKDTYALKSRGLCNSSEISDRKQTMASAKGSGPRDKDHHKVVSDTYVLQHHV